MFQNLLLTQEGGVLTIVINREGKLNALDLQTMKEIDAAMEILQKDDSIRAAILTGAGKKAFVAGADISEFTDLMPDEAVVFAQKGQEALFRIEHSKKPIIAAVNGFALGGGCELAMACHIRVASDNAKFGQPEVNLGLIPGYGGTQRLTNLIGKTKALELMMTADMVSADEALRLGLVSYVVPQADLMSKCLEIVSKILLKAPVAIAEVIKCVNAANSDGSGYAAEASAFGECCKTQDFKEGTSAFLEKRKANFQGK